MLNIGRFGTNHTILRYYELRCFSNDASEVRALRCLLLTFLVFINMVVLTPTIKFYVSFYNKRQRSHNERIQRKQKQKTIVLLWIQPYVFMLKKDFAVQTSEREDKKTLRTNITLLRIVNNVKNKYFRRPCRMTYSH